MQIDQNSYFLLLFLPPYFKKELGVQKCIPIHKSILRAKIMYTVVYLYLLSKGTINGTRVKVDILPTIVLREYRSSRSIYMIHSNLGNTRNQEATVDILKYNLGVQNTCFLSSFITDYYFQLKTKNQCIDFKNLSCSPIKVLLQLIFLLACRFCVYSEAQGIFRKLILIGAQFHL